MILELPGLPPDTRLPPEDLRLELACALFARNRIGKPAAAQMAGVDFFTFQEELSERQIPLITEQMLAGDRQSLRDGFP